MVTDMSFYKGVRICLGSIFKCLFRVHIHGAENQPTDCGYLVVSNHISFLDVFTIAVALRPQVRFMAKKELFSVPVLRGLIKALGAFPVDRKGSAVAPIKKSIALIEAGEVVGMFPTGHRYSGVKFDTTREYMKGGASMVCNRAKATVLPMFISTKNDKVALLRRIDVYVGKPIAFEEFAFEASTSVEYDRGAGIMYERIAALMPEERRSK